MKRRHCRSVRWNSFVRKHDSSRDSKHISHFYSLWWYCYYHSYCYLWLCWKNKDHYKSIVILSYIGFAWIVVSETKCDKEAIAWWWKWEKNQRKFICLVLSPCVQVNYNIWMNVKNETMCPCHQEQGKIKKNDWL